MHSSPCEAVACALFECAGVNVYVPKIGQTQSLCYGLADRRKNHNCFCCDLRV